MSRNFNLCILVLLLCLACEKTRIIDPSSAPGMEVETLPVSIISSHELTFAGSILKENKEEVIDFGFVLYDLGSNPQSPLEISVRNTFSKTERITYQYTSTTPFEIGRPFAYVFYVKTKKAYYKGEMIPFEIDLIRVDASETYYAAIGGTFDISGDFAQIDDSYYLTLGTSVAKPLLFEMNNEKTSLHIHIPTDELKHGEVLDLVLHRKSPFGSNRYTRSLAQVELLGHVDAPEETIELYYHDLLPLTGVGFPTVHYDKLHVIVEGKAHYLSTNLRLSDFGPFEKTTLNWSIDYGNKVVDFPHPIVLKQPSGEGVILSHTTIHPFEPINVTGLDYVRYFSTIVPQVKLGNIPVEQASIYQNTMAVHVGNIAPGSYHLYMETPMYTVQSPHKLDIKAFDVSSLSVAEAYPNDEVIVNGTFIQGHEYYVYFSSASWGTGYQAASTKELHIKIPNVAPNTSEVQIGYYNVGPENLPSGSRQQIKILKSKVDDITPKTVKPGEYLTIRGNGLEKFNFVFFDNYTLPHEAHSNELIKIRIPYSINPGKYKISLDNGYYWGDLRTDYIIEIL